MSQRVPFSAAIAACALSFVGAASFADTVSYDFTPVAGTGNGDGATLTSPVTVQGSVSGQSATFSSAVGNTYQFGPNAGLYSTLGANVLSEAGFEGASLNIAFSSAQTGISFDFALFNPGDVLTLTTNTGASLNVTAQSVAGDLYPEALFNLVGATPFTSVTIASNVASASPVPITIADLQTTPVPVPAPVYLLASGLLGMGVASRRRRPA